MYGFMVNTYFILHLPTTTRPPLLGIETPERLLLVELHLLGGTVEGLIVGVHHDGLLAVNHGKPQATVRTERPERLHRNVPLVAVAACHNDITARVTVDELRCRPMLWERSS